MNNSLWFVSLAPTDSGNAERAQIVHQCDRYMHTAMPVDEYI